MKKVKKVDRRAELLKFVDNDPNLIPMVDNLLFLEQELDKLRGMPMIRVHPVNPARQKPTAAAKMYKEFLQQYVNVFKALQKATGAEDDEESPLRKWAKSRNVKTD